MPGIRKLETELTIVTKQLGKKEKSLLTPEANMDALSDRVQSLGLLLPKKTVNLQ